MRLTVFLAILTFAVVGCAGGSKKKDDAKAGTKMEKGDAKMAKKDGKDDKMAGKDTMSAGSVSKTECSMKNDKRFVEVKASGKGCELSYSKFGNEETVATSMSGTDHCQKIGDRIIGNLENAGFQCKK